MLYSLAKSFLMALPAETAHNLVMGLLKMCFVPFTGEIYKHPCLKQTICSLDFENPLGLAAGFDKNAEVIKPISSLGFGFIELGTVTPKAQRGNEKPRVFRSIRHKSVIHSMGNPNKGLSVFKKNLGLYLERRKNQPRPVLGVNIGKNKSTIDLFEDYILATKELSPLVDYLVVNVSPLYASSQSDTQKNENLLSLLNKITEERQKVIEHNKDNHFQPPLFVKIDPDMNSLTLQEIIQSIMAASVDGIIVSDTTSVRPLALSANLRNQQGGLSGGLLKPLATKAIEEVYAITQGKIPIIGVGGIANARDAYEKIKAGANLLQLYTGLIYYGPGLVKKINKGLTLLLQADGYQNIAEAVGANNVKE